MLKKIWSYGTKTPIQRVGVIILMVGLFSLLGWVYKANLSFEDIFDSYYFPRSRDFIFFHLYLYLVPLGFLMAWGYSFLIKIKKWIMNEPQDSHSFNTLSIKIKERIKELTAPTPRKKNLHFKNNLAAFEFASSLYNPDLFSGKNFFGIVRKVCNPEGERSFLIIELAGSEEEIFVTGTNDKYFDLLSVGNIVYWGLEESFGEKRLLDVVAKGRILATLHPEFNPNTKLWSIRNNLTK